MTADEAVTNKPRWRRALIEVLVFVLLAANIEVFCCWRLYAEGYESGQATATLHPRWGWRMIPFPDNRINSDGLRGDEIAAPSGGDELRILCIGGSVTYGVGVSDAYPYPVQLQNRLRHELPGRAVTVINGGSSGMASHQFLQVLADLYDKLRPNVIVVMCGVNEKGADSYLRLEPEAAKGIYRAPDYVDATRGVLYKSATYRYLRWKLRSSPIVDAHPTQLPDGSAATEISKRVTSEFQVLRNMLLNLELITRFARARGVHLLLAIEAHRVRTLGPLLGNPDSAYFIEANFDRQLTLETSLVEALAQALDVPFIDMTPAVLSRDYDETDVFNASDAVHFSRLGNGIAADVLAEEMARLGWLGPVILEPSRRARAESYPGLDKLPAPARRRSPMPIP